MGRSSGWASLPFHKRKFFLNFADFGKKPAYKRKKFVYFSETA